MSRSTYHPLVLWLLPGLRFLCLLAGCSALLGCDDPKPNGSLPPKEAVTESDGPAATILGDAGRVSGEITFSIDDKPIRSKAVKTLVAELPQKRITSHDPYYEAKKEFFAVPAASLLKAGFDLTERQIHDATFSLEATDGYQVEIPGESLSESRAYFAYQDARGAWEPIGSKKANPGPLYLVWSGKQPAHDGKHPRPWGVVRIRKLEGDRFEHIRPPEGFGEDRSAEQGYELFSSRCLRCHSINREGGSVGPELNVPRNILEYRDREQLAAFIENPQSFRYSAMPAHPDLGKQDLKNILDYLALMGQHQHDPDSHTQEPEADITGNRTSP